LKASVIAGREKGNEVKKKSTLKTSATIKGGNERKKREGQGKKETLDGEENRKGKNVRPHGSGTHK